MERQSYLKNAVVLTSADFILRIAGMGFRIYLVGALGEEGVGLFQLIMSFYAVFITLATAGVSIASTRLLTEELSQNKANARGMLSRLLWLAFGIGVFATIVQFVLADVAARYWIGDVRVVLALRVVAFALPFMAIASVLRGFFMAMRRVQPNVYSQMAEQILRIIITVWLLFETQNMSLEIRCAVILLGATIGEALSCGVMVLFYQKEAKNVFADVKKTTPSGTKKRIWDIIWPISSGRVLSSALHAAENMLVPACLAVYLIAGGGRSEALVQYGVLKGMVMPLLVFPMGLLGSLATLLMPEITEAHVLGKKLQMQRLLHKMITITMYASLLGGVMFYIFGASLGELLYQSAETGDYLKILAPMAPFMYLENMVTGALKGLGEQKATFRYSAIDSICRIVGVVLLLPHFGIISFLYIVFASNVYTCFMNTWRLLKVTQVKMYWWQWLVYPLLACGIVFFIGDLMLAFARQKQAQISAYLVDTYNVHIKGSFPILDGLSVENTMNLAERISAGGVIVLIAVLMVGIYAALAFPLGLRKALTGGRKNMNKN